MGANVSTNQIKSLLVETFGLDYNVADIADDMGVVGEGLELDSVDVLEMIVQFEKNFGVKLKNQQINPADFKTIRSIADLVNRAA